MGRRKLDMFPTKFVFRGERSTKTVELFGTLVERVESLHAAKVNAEGGTAPSRSAAGGEYE
jgi:hypothetical protein